MHDMKVRVRVHRHDDGRLAIFHGPSKLATYNKQGKLEEAKPTLLAASIHFAANTKVGCRLVDQSND